MKPNEAQGLELSSVQISLGGFPESQMNDLSSKICNQTFVAFLGLSNGRSIFEVELEGLYQNGPRETQLTARSVTKQLPCSMLNFVGCRLSKGLKQQNPALQVLRKLGIP